MKNKKVGQRGSLPVIVVIGQLDVGGAERHLSRVLPRLAERGFDISLFLIRGGGVLQPLIEASGIPIHYPSGVSRGWRRVFEAALLFMRVIRCRRPCIVHFFLPEAYLVGGLCSLPFRGCVRIMSRRSLNDYQKKHPILTQIERGLHRYMATMVGNSRDVVAQLIDEGAPAANVKLLYSGIDLPDLDAYPETAELRKRMHIPHDCFVLIVVANLIVYKGHADLVEALGIVRDSLPWPWMALFLGKDWGIGNELKNRAVALRIDSNILFLGLQNDVLPFIKLADLGVLPSHEEGLSNALLEYMAAGLPVIATDVGGNRELVIDGETGLLVPAGDQTALGNALVRMAGDARFRESAAIKAKARIVDNFSMDACVSAYERLYSDLGRTTQRD